MSGRKVGERSTKLLGFIVPHYFYIYNISSHDFGVIQTPRAEIYIFTTGTLYKISSRALLPPSLRTGIFTVECACPEPFRGTFERSSSLSELELRLTPEAVEEFQHPSPNHWICCPFWSFILRFISPRDSSRVLVR